MNVKIATLSDIGGRDNNDDTVSFRQKGDCAWIYVGDGLGAYAGGKLASEVVGQTILEESHRGSMLWDDRMQEVAKKSNEAVRNLQARTGGRMMTTMVLLAIEDGRARWMHIGDTRLYHFQNRRLIKQTMDHSVSQMAVLMGEIQQNQIRFHEDRNRILRAVGSDSACPELSPTKILTAGEDAFLLCTDGFWEYVYEEEMESLLHQAADPQQWLNRMEELLRKRAPAENDNFTAAAVFC